MKKFLWRLSSDIDVVYEELIGRPIATGLWRLDRAGAGHFLSGSRLKMRAKDLVCHPHNYEGISLTPEMVLSLGGFSRCHVLSCTRSKVTLCSACAGRRPVPSKISMAESVNSAHIILYLPTPKTKTKAKEAQTKVPARQNW